MSFLKLGISYVSLRSNLYKLRLYILILLAKLYIWFLNLFIDFILILYLFVVTFWSLICKSNWSIFPWNFNSFLILVIWSCNTSGSYDVMSTTNCFPILSFFMLSFTLSSSFRCHRHQIVLIPLRVWISAVCFATWTVAYQSCMHNWLQ
jgi:hypothetical protein